MNRAGRWRRSSFCLRVAASIVFLFLTAPLQSQDAGTPSPAGEIVEVTARRRVSTAESTGTTTIIHLDEIRHRYTRLEELLEKETSLHVNRYGGLGAHSTLSIRGSNANQVNVYLDGIPLNNAATGEINLADLNLDNLERIEIYRSGTPGGFSGGAPGGAINLVSAAAREGEGRRVALGGGSHHTVRGSGRTWGARERSAYSFAGSWEQSDQDYRFHNDNGTPVFNRWDDFDDTRRNAWFRNFSFTGNLDYRLGATTFRFLDDLNFRRHGVPGPGNNQTEKTERRHLRNTAGASGDTRGFLIPQVRLRSRVFYTEQRDAFFDPLQEFAYGNPNSRDRIQLYGAHLLPDLHLPRWHQIVKIFAGLERESYRREVRNRFDEMPERIPAKFRNHSSLHLEDEITPGNGDFVISPAVRYEHYRDRFNDEARPAGATDPRLPGYTDHEFTNYRLGLSYTVYRRGSNALHLRGSASTERRMPDFLELFGEQGRIVGNRELRPERSRTGELGPVFRAGNGLGVVDTALTAFHRELRDMIVLIPNSQFTLRPENIDAARVDGVELAFKMELLRSVRFYLNYTYQQAINTSDVAYLKGKYLPLRPLHESSTGLIFWSNHWEFGIESHFVGAVFRDRTNEYQNYQPGRWIYNTHLTWSRFGRQERGEEMLLTLEIKNILDRRLEDVVGYPLPGRTAYLNFTRKW